MFRALYRLDFWDFHPEKALEFLPHEPDFTHLRMILISNLNSFTMGLIFHLRYDIAALK
jgi:hypothetical protein